MAQKTVVLFEDDLDGGPAAETVSFALDGVTYELDVSESNAARLRELFGPYVGSARRIGGPPPSPTRKRAGGPAKADRAQLAAIRTWAHQRGLAINKRGRIPAHILQQYNADPMPVSVEPAARGKRAKKTAGLTFSAPE